MLQSHYVSFHSICNIFWMKFVNEDDSSMQYIQFESLSRIQGALPILHWFVADIYVLKAHISHPVWCYDITNHGVSACP